MRSPQDQGLIPQKNQMKKVRYELVTHKQLAHHPTANDDDVFPTTSDENNNKINTDKPESESDKRPPSKSEITERKLREIRERKESEAEMAEGKQKAPTYFGVFGDDHRSIEKGIQHFIYERDVMKEFASAIAQRAKVKGGKRGRF